MMSALYKSSIAYIIKISLINSVMVLKAGFPITILVVGGVLSLPISGECLLQEIVESNHQAPPPPPHLPSPLSKFRTKRCSWPSRKKGLILCYLSLLLNICYARHVDEIISNQWLNTKIAGLVAGLRMSKLWLTSVSGRWQNPGLLN